jgi:glutathione peroxidase
MSIYDFKIRNIDDEEVNLAQYRGKVLLVVNTASKCGFTPQYGDLQKLYEKYNSKGFEILGFPCNQFAEQEPGNNEEVKKFCEINYGVTFPILEKVEVRGEDIHPIFKYLTEAAPFEGVDKNGEKGKGLFAFINEKFPEFLEGNSIKWNFTKFLIDKEGNVIKRYESPVEPMDISKDIENII